VSFFFGGPDLYDIALTQPPQDYWEKVTITAPAKRSRRLRVRRTKTRRELEAQIAELTAALNRHGWHDKYCDTAYDRECSCGLDAALRKAGIEP
jgi:hypothetical protein